MPVTRPFRRTFRQLADGTYRDSGNGQYVTHPKYAVAPGQYVRAYLLLQKNLLELFDYVEPSDVNLSCYFLSRSRASCLRPRNIGVEVLEARAQVGHRRAVPIVSRTACVAGAG